VKKLQVARRWASREQSFPAGFSGNAEYLKRSLILNDGFLLMRDHSQQIGKKSAVSRAPQAIEASSEVIL
jgi:hypothetical protein